MPFSEVMGKFKRGKLHSGSKSGPKVKSRKQAVAIMMSEKRKGTHRKGYQTGGVVMPVERERYKHGGMAEMAYAHEYSKKKYGKARKKAPKRGFASIPSR